MLRESNLIPYFKISSLDYWIIVIPRNRSFIKTLWRLPRSSRTLLHMSRGQLWVTILNCYGALWLAQHVNVTMVSMNSSSCQVPDWRKETQIWHTVTSNLKRKVREAARRCVTFSAGIITGSTTDFFGLNYIRRTMGLTGMVWEVSADGTITQWSECLWAEHMLNPEQSHCCNQSHFCPMWLKCTTTRFALLL